MKSTSISIVRHRKAISTCLKASSVEVASRVLTQLAKAWWSFAARRTPDAVSGSTLLGLLWLALSCQITFSAGQPLKISVYCTAGTVQRELATPEGRERVSRAIEPLGVSRLFLEGRRGDEYVPPQQLRELRDFFATKGIECSGGIATVPGANFGVRQTGGLDWLNWESPKTRADVAGFFAENAPVFDELIVDDFYCTGDVSSESDLARGGRAWGDYRRDLLVSLIEPMIVRPTRAANRRTELIIKFPQWYDRFHVFGYDPPRMSKPFVEVWVGTEVRDPLTRRMGFVQPTEGYMNYRWISSAVGRKVRGAWFDHIECSAQNFVDQAYQSVLAGARELTLFHLGDLITPHPGDVMLAERMPELRELAARLQGKTRRGIPFYKPPGSAGDENLYLADYLGMIGLPILPVAQYPKDAKVVFLPVQAAADAALLENMRRHLKRGATLVVTPALLRAVGRPAVQLAGVEIGSVSEPRAMGQVQIGTARTGLNTPLDLDDSVRLNGAGLLASALSDGGQVPLLTRNLHGRGQVVVLNVRTFSDTDFGRSEWLLAPRPLGLAAIPQPLADRIRETLLAPMDLEFRSPAGVALVLAGNGACVYNFRNEATQVAFGGRRRELTAHGFAWLD